MYCTLCLIFHNCSQEFQLHFAQNYKEDWNFHFKNSLSTLSTMLRGNSAPSRMFVYFFYFIFGVRYGSPTSPFVGWLVGWSICPSVSHMEFVKTQKLSNRFIECLFGQNTILWKQFFLTNKCRLRKYLTILMIMKWLREALKISQFLDIVQKIEAALQTPHPQWRHT